MNPTDIEPRTVTLDLRPKTPETQKSAPRPTSGVSNARGGGVVWGGGEH